MCGLATPMSACCVNENAENDVRSMGQQCGDGWNGLIQPLKTEVIQLGGTIRQIKEKFGRLCFFYSLPSNVSDASREALRRRVQQAEEAITSTCEKCGKPGALVSIGSIYRTACEECCLL
jgi:hypothetical protein